MSDYRRIKRQGGYYFFTVVTYKRRHFLTTPPARAILRSVFKNTRTNHPFEIVALCLMPDHLHCIWRLPPGDADYSKRWMLIKKNFTYHWLRSAQNEATQSESRTKHRHRGIWQRRFWEHRIRDAEDYWNHIRYVHHNPVKHGLVERVEDWPFSTYHKYAAVSPDPSAIASIQDDLENIFDME